MEVSAYSPSNWEMEAGVQGWPKTHMGPCLKTNTKPKRGPVGGLGLVKA